MKRKKLKKLENRLGKRVLSGKVTLDEALHKLGRNVSQKSAAPALAKAQSARPGLTAEAIREAVFAGFRSARPLTEQDVLNAARPLTRPPVTKATAPVRRETPAQALEVLKSMTAPAPVRPAASWTPVELNMLREIDKITDPVSREQARSALIKRVEGNVT
jgi:hypothetical protein